jgi:hypothetical protein
MCRTKELGGRRCPQHTDPVKHAAYNARRRELYAAQKSITKNNDQASLESRFLGPDQRRKPAGEQEHLSFVKDTETYRDSLAEYEKTTYSNDYAEWRASPKKTDQWGGSPRAALRHYTEMGYSDVRNYLNGFSMEVYRDEDEAQKAGVEVKPQDNADMAGFVRMMDKVISLAPKPAEPRMLYRGIDPPSTAMGKEAEWLKEKFPIGGIVSQKSYMSTSLEPSIAAGSFSLTENSVVMEILSKEGAALGVGQSTWGLQESEVVLPRDAKLKVVAVYQDVKYGYTKVTREMDGEVLAEKDAEEKRTIIQVIHVTDEDES